MGSDFWTFLPAFLMQSTADLYHTWRNDRRRQHNASTTFWDRSATTARHLESGSGLIQKFGFSSPITFGSNFGVGGGLRSLTATTVFSSRADPVAPPVPMSDCHYCVLFSWRSGRATSAVPMWNSLHIHTRSCS